MDLQLAKRKHADSPRLNTALVFSKSENVNKMARVLCQCLPYCQNNLSVDLHHKTIHILVRAALTHSIHETAVDTNGKTIQRFCKMGRDTGDHCR